MTGSKSPIASGLNISVARSGLGLNLIVGPDMLLSVTLGTMNLFNYVNTLVNKVHVLFYFYYLSACFHSKIYIPNLSNIEGN